MATLTIKNLPDEVYATLSETAKRNRRSINGEAIFRLERSLDLPVRESKEEMLANIRKDRNKLAKMGVRLTEKLLTEGKRHRN
ncbi:MAG: Arc family DNA-binding protein [Acidobacteria bacterium]|nr:Arc family DNA-binding protein [Acidobacteriota bacterium]